MISIIIPTLNEEKYLPHLLRSLRRQTFREFEVIVSDNNSKDTTVAIAKKAGCKVLLGGIPSLAKNNGAKVASYDLLFLDADVTLDDPQFLERFMKKIKERNLDFATCWVNPDTKKLSSAIFYFMKNFNNKFLGYIFPLMSGQCIFVKKKFFIDIHGFDPLLKVAEEHDFYGRARKKGKYDFFTDIHVTTSARRVEKIGFIKLCLMNFYFDLSRIFFGNKKRKDYEFGKF